MTIDKQWRDETLTPMLAALRDDLGLPECYRLKSELHAVLVYSPGQFFVPHRDFEKSDAMVATLSLILPGSSKGGALVTQLPSGRPMRLGFGVWPWRRLRLGLWIGTGRCQRTPLMRVDALGSGSDLRTSWRLHHKHWYLSAKDDGLRDAAHDQLADRAAAASPDDQQLDVGVGDEIEHRLGDVDTGCHVQRPLDIGELGLPQDVRYLVAKACPSALRSCRCRRPRRYG